MRRSLRAPVLAAVAIVLGVGAGTATAAPATADTSDFSYDSWHVEYRIGSDADGRAVAQVTETLVARFPDFDQNRGIVRGLPIDYEGASTDPRGFLISDEHGAPVPFDIERDNGFVAVLVGDDSFVHGVQTYVIEYTLSDVILARDDGAADEFYWDIVDFEHLQPISEFSAEIRFDQGLADRLNGDARCYVGTAHSTAECELEQEGSTYTISPMPLGPREGATAAIGLLPGSVAQPSARLPNFLLDVAPLLVGGAGLAAALGATVSVGVAKRRRRRGRGTIIAQYEVPGELPPLLSAPIIGAARSPVAAQIVHLAVTGAIRIEEGAEKEGWLASRKAQPVLRLLDPGRTAHPLDERAITTLFPSRTPGLSMTVPKRSESFGAKMRKLQAAGTSEAVRLGYLEKVRSPLGLTLALISAGLLAMLAVLLVWGLATRDSPAVVIGMMLGGVSVFLTIFGLSKHRMHTPLGAETREYLEGVREFIRVAEADRLRMLQSYTGAERRQDGTVDVIHLYERLLPYAMLFGLEKEWSRTLEVTYSEHDGYVPLWYPAMGLHGIAAMSSTLTQFTSSLNSSVSYTSSSSGGSSGGGFAGGGGGGGFSGGR